ncbi:MAG: methyl-accepting chemotaxis protein, partial [Deltaproteobacteria bacterium]|nr:methyl-accepting chemotaxis protein [Deltaproteobacteria bacterium]
MSVSEGVRAETVRNEILEKAESLATQENHLMTGLARRNRTFRIMIGGVQFLTLVLLFFVIRRTVENPMLRLTTIIDQFQKDIFPEIPFLQRRDQIGVLARAIGELKQSRLKINRESQQRARAKDILEELFHHIFTTIEELEKQAVNLVELAEQQKRLATETRRQLQFAGSLVTETAGNTEKVQQSTLAQHQAIDNIRKRIDLQHRIVTQVSQQAEQSRDAIHCLGLESLGINQTAKTVQTITKQTRLLAINATIEASTTAKQSRGFAVVAAEVKHLSGQTSAANQEIMTREVRQLIAETARRRSLLDRQAEENEPPTPQEDESLSNNQADAP